MIAWGRRTPCASGRHRADRRVDSRSLAEHDGAHPLDCPVCAPGRHANDGPRPATVRVEDLVDLSRTGWGGSE